MFDMVCMYGTQVIFDMAGMSGISVKSSTYICFTFIFGLWDIVGMSGMSGMFDIAEKSGI